MVWVVIVLLVSVVFNVGGFGIIVVGNVLKEVIKKEIVECKKLIDKFFGVNVMFMLLFVDDIIDLIIEEKV